MTGFTRGALGMPASRAVLLGRRHRMRRTGAREGHDSEHVKHASARRPDLRPPDSDVAACRDRRQKRSRALGFLARRPSRR